MTGREKMGKTMQATKTLGAMRAALLAVAGVATMTSAAPATAQPAVAMNAAQVKDDLFAGTDKFAKGAKESTEINLDPRSMGMMKHGEGDGGMAKKMNFIVIHTYSYDQPGMYSMDDLDVFRKRLDEGGWSCSVRVREKQESTDICSREGADHESSEMAIIAAEPKELTFIHMSGKMPLDELMKAGGGMAGLKHR